MKKSTRKNSDMLPELKKIPKQIKDKIRPLVQKLLDKCSNVKVLPRKAEWEEMKEIFDIIQDIQEIEKPYNPTLPERNCHWESFYTWCSEHGAEFSSIKIKEISDENFGTVAEKKILENEAFLHVPRKIMMSEDTAKDSKLGPLIAKDPILQHMSNVQMAIHLLAELLNANSFWKPYIFIFPSSFNTILYFTMEELQELQGSFVLDEVFKILRSVARQYCYFFQLFQNDSYARSLNISPYFTYDLYRWAVSAVMTRQNVLPSQNGKKQVTTLIPLFDMCNHTNGKLSTDFSLQSDTLISYSCKTFLQGEEVCIFYGPRTNAEFFVHNGFVYPDNENDAVEIKLGISKSDNLFTLKNDLCSKMCIPLSGSFPVYKGGVLSTGLLSFLLINVMKADELQKVLSGETFAPSMLDEFTDLKQRAFKFLKDRVFLLLRSYKTTLEEDEDLMKSQVPESAHLCLILQLRMCEKKILKDLYNYCSENII